MIWLVGCLMAVIVVLGFLLYLLMGVFRISALDRRDHRKDELAFLSESGKQGQTVFFGDSITHYCPVEEIYAAYTERSGLRVYNRGIASETSADALKRLDSNVLALDPANLVILLGCNDIGEKIPTDQTVRNLEEIIRRVREKNPAVHIILQAVYPIRETGNSLPARYLIGGRSNEKVQALNKELNAMTQRQNVLFADLTDLLADGSGQLREDYTADGLHVNERAYQKIAARLTPLLIHGTEGDHAGA